MILLCFARFIYLQVLMQYISLNQYENFMQKNNVPFYLHLFMNKKNLNCWRRHINQTIFHHCETHNVSIQMIKRHFFMFHFRFFFIQFYAVLWFLMEVFFWKCIAIFYGMTFWLVYFIQYFIQREKNSQQNVYWEEFFCTFLYIWMFY